MRSNAQTDSILLGSWKLAAVSNEGMYYDVIKDSLYISQAVMNEIGTLEEQTRFKKSLSLYKGIKFLFERNGLFKQMRDDQLIATGSYETLGEKPTLEFKIEGNKEESTIRKIAFEIKNNQLKLFIKDEKLFDFILEKN